MFSECQRERECTSEAVWRMLLVSGRVKSMGVNLRVYDEGAVLGIFRDDFAFHFDIGNAAFRLADGKRGGEDDIHVDGGMMARQMPVQQRIPINLPSGSGRFVKPPGRTRVILTRTLILTLIPLIPGHKDPIIARIIDWRHFFHGECVFESDAITEQCNDNIRAGHRTARRIC